MSFLNSNLNLDHWRDRLGATGRVVISDILDSGTADKLHAELEGDIDWEISLTTATGPAAIDAATIANASQSERGELRRQIIQQATTRFSYCYGRYELIPGKPRKLLAAKEFLGSEKFLEFMRGLTGDSELMRADAHATVYQPGHFLKKHDDIYADKDRRYAYVFGFSRNWQADWGGLLGFLDKQGDVEEVLVPGYNTLTVFSVPQDHFVSLVSEFAGSQRLAITGWLFADS